MRAFSCLGSRQCRTGVAALFGLSVIACSAEPQASSEAGYRSEVLSKAPLSLSRYIDENCAFKQTHNAEPLLYWNTGDGVTSYSGPDDQERAFRHERRDGAIGCGDRDYFVEYMQYCESPEQCSGAWLLRDVDSGEVLQFFEGVAEPRRYASSGTNAAFGQFLREYMNLPECDESTNAATMNTSANPDPIRNLEAAEDCASYTAALADETMERLEWVTPDVETCVENVVAMDRNLNLVSKAKALGVRLVIGYQIESGSERPYGATNPNVDTSRACQGVKESCDAGKACVNHQVCRPTGGNGEPVTFETENVLVAYPTEEAFLAAIQHVGYLAGKCSKTIVADEDAAIPYCDDPRKSASGDTTEYFCN